jgi:hypothetical protein
MRTKSLFHFTKRLDVLLSILKNGFWPSYCFEDISWVSGNDFYGSSMVCFCDISLPKLERHTAFYGRFGIGMKREWGVSNGLNPLLYVSTQSIVCEAISRTFANPDPANTWGKRDVMVTLAHTKPLVGKMRIAGDIIEKEFYEECEWRFVDLSRAGIFPSEAPTAAALDTLNEKAREYPLEFEASDVKYLLVESESDVGPLVDFINSELVGVSQEQLRLLATKILVLDSLRHDL